MRKAAEMEPMRMQREDQSPGSWSWEATVRMALSRVVRKTGAEAWHDAARRVVGEAAAED